MGKLEFLVSAIKDCNGIYIPYEIAKMMNELSDALERHIKYIKITTDQGESK